MYAPRDGIKVRRSRVRHEEGTPFPVTYDLFQSKYRMCLVHILHLSLLICSYSYLLWMHYLGLYDEPETRKRGVQDRRCIIHVEAVTALDRVEL